MSREFGGGLDCFWQPEREELVSNKLALTLTLFILFAAPLALAQMRGGGAGGGGGQGSGMGGGQRGAGMGRPADFPDMGSSQMQQRRQQMHTTDQQDRQYRRCSQAMNRVRTRLRQISKLSSTQPLPVAQLIPLQDQLSADVQDMQQQLNELVASLNDEQKTADQEKIEDLMQSTKDLEAFADALGYELEQENVETAKVREELRTADGAAKQVQKQERELAESLGIAP
jgi:chromosome segregation ATPase